ncbi:hypothetical protein LZ32DRAFT_649529 [Colletotrichum eremochloae]|nr:hypothetical protein LZ32DRAFT_649529 [Colletotrichum eremochloae]
MAKTSQKARRSVKPLTSWTRFRLPREQEWPTWSVDHAHAGGHYGPLKGVKGCLKAWLGRMVDDPEQAVYIIDWTNLEALKNFQSSPACAEFLQGLPESNDDSQVSVESGSAPREITSDDTSSSSTPAASRFLVFQHVTPAVTPDVEEGRVIVTAFLVPRKVDSVSSMWKEDFEQVFSCFVPRGFEPVVAQRKFLSKFSHVWFGVLSEDRWVEDKFGKSDDDNGSGQGRTIICHFHLWPWRCGATPEMEAASAADPQAREAWGRAIAQVMPPATAWVQERWEIRSVPYPPAPEHDSEELSEFDKEQEELTKLFFKEHGLEKDESSE